MPNVRCFVCWHRTQCPMQNLNLGLTSHLRFCSEMKCPRSWLSCLDFPTVVLYNFCVLSPVNFDTIAYFITNMLDRNVPVQDQVVGYDLPSNNQRIRCNFLTIRRINRLKINFSSHALYPDDIFRGQWRYTSLPNVNAGSSNDKALVPSTA